MDDEMQKTTELWRKGFVDGVRAHIEVLIHRIEVLDAKFTCQQNRMAIHHLREALTALEVRTIERQARGVEGKLES